MRHEQSLFSNYKYCAICKIPLTLEYEKDVCPACEREQLFHEVKEFIRSNDVNEYDVVEEFQIPHSQVKQWIREGRIEYRESPERLNASSRVPKKCIKCGGPVAFENAMCPKCKRQQRNEQAGIAPSPAPASAPDTEDSGNNKPRLRFH